MHITLPQSFVGLRVHLVGIKGTGMAALAEVLAARRAIVSGSDTQETFYTDAVLRRLGIPFAEGFAPSNIPAGTALVVHSAAYAPEGNPELAAAAAAGIPIASYPEALGLLSGMADASGVCGVHGKSTTTALCGMILKAWDFPATVIVGAEVPGFGGRSTVTRGEKYLVAETCEYRRHFLSFHPRRILITSIEPDHLDYFKDREDVLSAFEEYGRSLPNKGAVIYCADDAGASEAANRIARRRDDLRLVPYGRSAEGDFRASEIRADEGKSSLRLAGIPFGFTLRVPGEHLALNAAGALALCREIWRAERGQEPFDAEAARDALQSFTGARRRSEVVGEAKGILVMDDYAHHPTAVAKTIMGIRAFYPGRRLVVSFMSHTYSRTKALLAGFGRSFAGADEVILHRIYASAREEDAGSVVGEDLVREVAKHHPRVRYIAEPLDAVTVLARELRPGDLFLTMGAGDNWRLGKELLRQLEGGA